MTLDTQKLHRYSISVRDFEKSKEYLDAAKRYSPCNIEYEALLFAAIVSFTRPFSSNEKSRTAAASPKLIIEDFEPLSTEKKELHRRLIMLRNKALAHSEFECNPTGFDENLRIFSSRPFSLLGENLDLDLFSRVIAQYIEVCHDQRANHAHGRS